MSILKVSYDKGLVPTSGFNLIIESIQKKKQKKTEAFTFEICSAKYIYLVHAGGSKALQETDQPE